MPSTLRIAADHERAVGVAPHPRPRCVSQRVADLINPQQRARNHINRPVRADVVSVRQDAAAVAKDNPFLRRMYIDTAVVTWCADVVSARERAR